jgi:hypothetical protein
MLSFCKFSGAFINIIPFKYKLTDKLNCMYEDFGNNNFLQLFIRTKTIVSKNHEENSLTHFVFDKHIKTTVNNTLKENENIYSNINNHNLVNSKNIKDELCSDSVWRGNIKELFSMVSVPFEKIYFLIFIIFKYFLVKV